jgi:AAA15 family ATPase/GTPase
MSDKMIYKKFYFNNYKGIKEKVEIDIDANSDKPYCIIGNNEGGKTTILKGINLIGKLCVGGKIKDQDLIKIKPKIDFFSETLF